MLLQPRALKSAKVMRKRWQMALMFTKLLLHAFPKSEKLLQQARSLYKYRVFFETRVPLILSGAAFSLPRLLRYGV